MTINYILFCFDLCCQICWFSELRPNGGVRNAILEYKGRYQPWPEPRQDPWPLLSDCVGHTIQVAVLHITNLPVLQQVLRDVHKQLQGKLRAWSWVPAAKETDGWQRSDFQEAPRWHYREAERSSDKVHYQGRSCFLLWVCLWLHLSLQSTCKESIQTLNGLIVIE